jgi:hypothetical protein
MKVIQTHLTIGLIDRDVDASSASTSGIIWPHQVACDCLAHCRARARQTGGELFRSSVARCRGQAGAGSDQRGTARPPDRYAIPPRRGGSARECHQKRCLRTVKFVSPKDQARFAQELCDSCVTETWQHLGALPTESHCCRGTRVDPLYRLQYNPQHNSVRHSPTKQQIECSYQSTARFDRESRTIVLSRKALTGRSYVFQETLWRGAKSANQSHRVGAARWRSRVVLVDRS